jgi:hypothetical protein
MFWFFHRGLPARRSLGEGRSPHLQRAHAGRTQAHPPNPCAFGTSGISAAEQPRMPEASGIGDWGRWAKI